MKNYSAISEMYYGNRGSHEDIKLNAEEKESLTKIVEIENEFVKDIKDNEKLSGAYNQLSNEQSNLNGLIMESAYKEGFRFGFLMALDVLDK